MFIAFIVLAELEFNLPNKSTSQSHSGKNTDPFD